MPPATDKDGFTTVVSKTSIKREKQKEKKKEKALNKEFAPRNELDERLGVKGSTVFEELEVAYMKKKAEKPAPTAYLEQQYGGSAFAALAVEDEAVAESRSIAKAALAGNGTAKSAPDADLDLLPMSKRERARAARAAKPKPKPKPEAPRKPAVPIAKASKAINLKKFDTFLSEIEAKHSDKVLCMQIVADYLQQAYKECQVVLDGPPEECMDAVLAEVPQGLNDVLEDFFLGTNKPSDAQQSFLTSLLRGCFEGLPDRPKGAGATIIRNKVGHWLALSIMLRMCPNVLLACGDRLLAMGRGLSAPGRIQALLWCIQQTSVANAAAPLGAWLRILLPQVLGSPLVTPLSNKAAARAAAGESADEAGPSCSQLDADSVGPAMRFLFSTLVTKGARMQCSPEVLEGARTGIQAEGRPEETQLAVPAAVLDTVLRCTMLPSRYAPTGEANRKILADLYPVLKQVWQRQPNSAESDSRAFLDALPLALDTAAVALGEPDDSARELVLSRVSANVLSVLRWEEGSAGFDEWTKKHKTHLLGSTAVLESIAGSDGSTLQPLVRYKELRARWDAMLEGMRERQKYARKERALRETAKAADKALDALTDMAGRLGYRNLTVGDAVFRLTVAGAFVFAGLVALATPRFRGTTYRLMGSFLGEGIADPLFDNVLDPVVLALGTHLGPVWEQAKVVGADVEVKVRSLAGQRSADGY